MLNGCRVEEKRGIEATETPQDTATPTEADKPKKEKKSKAAK